MTRLLRITLSALAALLCAAVPAQAGSYEVLACDAADGNANYSWSYQATLPAGALQGSTACPSAGDFSGLLARTALISNGDLTIPTTGAYAHWAFTAPVGLTITRLRLRRWLGMEGGSGWRLYGRTANGTTVPGETCTVPSGFDECNVGGFASTEIARTVDTTSLAYGFVCNPVGAGATQCVRGYTFHAARAAIYSAAVTLTDLTAPTITTPTGALVTEAGYHHGTETVTFGGADVTGVKSLAVAVDGVVRASVARACDYRYTLPCNYPGRPADPATATVSLDTTALSDGSHTVQSRVVDAAGNETGAAARSIVVDNHGPDLQAWLEPRADSSPTLAVGFVPSAGQVAPVTEVRWTLCPAASTTGCTATRTVATGNAGGRVDGIAIPSTGDWDLRLQLVDAAGHVGRSRLVAARYAIPIPSPQPTPIATPAPRPAPTPALTTTVPPVAVAERPAARRVARLELITARLTGSRLTVRGTLTTTATGTLTLRYRARAAGSTRVLKHTLPVHAGRFAATFALPRSARRATRTTVELRFAGDTALLPRTLRRAITDR